MFQGGTGFGDTSISFYMAGTDLAPTGTNTGTGKALYTTLYGGPNYTQSPNRPIDFVDAIGQAPYVAGLGLQGQSGDAFAAPDAADAPALQSIATNYAAGGAGITAAIATIDDLIRQGRSGVQTVTGSGTSFITPSPHGFVAQTIFLRFSVVGGTTYSGLDTKTLYFLDTTPSPTTFTVKPVVNGALGSTVNAGSVGSGTTSVGSSGPSASSIFNMQTNWFTKWESMAASFDASRPAAGLPNLKMQWYEGALEATAPTAAQCFNIGVTLPGDATGATAATAIANALIAWKNDAASSATIQLYYNTFMGLTAGYVTTNAMPHSLSTAQLVMLGGGVYALSANLSPNSPGLYQTYYGFSIFSRP